MKKMIKGKNEKQMQKVEKLCSIVGIVFLAIPFLYLLYLYVQSTILQKDIVSLVSINPVLNIYFLMMMISCFTGYQMLKIKRIIRNMHINIVIMNFLIVLVSQIFSMNIMMIVGMILVIYNVLQLSNEKLINILKYNFKNKNFSKCLFNITLLIIYIPFYNFDVDFI